MSIMSLFFLWSENVEKQMSKIEQIELMGSRKFYSYFELDLKRTYETE